MRTRLFPATYQLQINHLHLTWYSLRTLLDVSKMMKNHQSIVSCLLLCLLITYSPSNLNAADPVRLQIVVMDPLAAPLSCPCVEGYAQRKYETLATYIEEATGTPCDIAFKESLVLARKNLTNGRADIVIGKSSVVKADASKEMLHLKPEFSLTDLKSETTMKGLILVRGDDPAKTVKDIAGYQVIFGAEDCDEKYLAALNLLKAYEIAVPKKLETCDACSEGAVKLVELGPNCKHATVISSYAAPLLEGCGTIKKGDLKVVGETETVPFVELFINQDLSDNLKQELRQALLEMKESPLLCKALETKNGWVPIQEKSDKKKN